MSSTDEQRKDESHEAEDLALDEKQSEGVKGGAVLPPSKPAPTSPTKAVQPRKFPAA